MKKRRAPNQGRPPRPIQLVLNERAASLAVDFLNLLRGAVGGAVLDATTLVATGFWILLSLGLGIYFRSFAHFNKTYGTLGAAVALMVWVYYTGFVILVGAELNSALIQASGDGRLELKQPPSATVKQQPAAGSEPDIAA